MTSCFPWLQVNFSCRCFFRQHQQQTSGVSFSFTEWDFICQDDNERFPPGLLLFCHIARLSCADVCTWAYAVVTCWLAGLLFALLWDFSLVVISQPRGESQIVIRKYGFLLPPAEEKRCRSGQPSTHRALISHLDVIYCGLHRENSVYCNRDHNYHRSALSQDLCCVCMFEDGCTLRPVIVCLCVCHLCMH